MDGATQWGKRQRHLAPPTSAHAEPKCQVRKGHPLTPAEHRRLEAHCRKCVACQMEWMWLRDGHAAGDGVTAEDRQRASAALSILLEAGRVAPNLDPLSETPTHPSAGVRGEFWRSPRTLAWSMALAAGIVFGGGAAAALWDGVARLAAQLGIAAVVGGVGGPSARSGGPAAPTRPLAPPAVPAPEPPTEAAPQPSPPADPLQSDPTPADPGPSRPLRLDAERAASRLLTAASKARAAEDLSLADERYQRLAARYPQTRSARAGRIAHGQLLLDQLQRPARALSEFQAYLRATPLGELAEEARAGVAVAYERLGLATAEAAAWRDLLRHHPTTPHPCAAPHRTARALGRRS